ncbi:thiamine phosphate synthase [Fonticella tunisiensis]|uniref:Thiamine-phosphate synthase n=1 Tax=Fonticella tunisiensis TaxID=1096341 RepID=A0A4R7KNY8_9CLOT|nr:thiamine phosphate synthase [Fonticella tunisiensis]TDT57273.1 thiamine-phosphate diphosphorylase [Fonticella tunisiensis]
MKNKIDVNYSLYLVTDRGILNGRDLKEAVEEAILGGVTLVQLREKAASTLEFYNTALRVKAVTDKYNIPLIINDRLDIALAVDAAGLHVGQDDMPAHIARKILGPDRILGVSTANLKEALKAQEDGADYIGVGAMFPTISKSDTRDVTLDELKRIKESIKIPVVAIGGINQNNVKQIIELGADGAAVISAILGRKDIKQAALELKKKLNGDS